MIRVLLQIFKYLAPRTSQVLPGEFFFMVRRSRAPALENYFLTSRFAGACRPKVFSSNLAVRKRSAPKNCFPQLRESRVLSPIILFLKFAGCGCLQDFFLKNTNHYYY